MWLRGTNAVGTKRVAGNIKHTDGHAKALGCVGGTFIVGAQRDLGVRIFKCFRMNYLSVEDHRLGVAVSGVFVTGLTVRAVSIVVIPTGNLDDVEDVLLSRSAFATLSRHFGCHAIAAIIFQYGCVKYAGQTPS